MQASEKSAILSLVNDVETRWNSTLLLARRLLLLKNAVRLTLMNSTMNAEDLSNQEWELLAGVVKLLQPFEEVW